jgi:enoyl-CoA hydratase/carnithine racemase
MINSTVADGVCTITLARPEKKNALTAAMYSAMANAIGAAVADAGARVLLITGGPQVFTAGNDLEDFLERPPGNEDAPVFRFMHALAECPKPVVAAVNGVAVGIGTTMLLHCDLVYLGEGARLMLPFVSLGVVPEFASSLLLPARMGHARAAAKLMLGEPMSAAEALAAGIATAVLPDDQVGEAARAACARLVAQPAQALLETKRLMRAPQADAVRRAIAGEVRSFVVRLASDEARAAFARFLSKRPK